LLRVPYTHAILECSGPRSGSCVGSPDSRFALETIRDSYGVRWLLMDRIYAPPATRLAFLGRPAFENDALIVYRLPASGPLPSG
jgi:hypothetical protein